MYGEQRRAAYAAAKRIAVDVEGWCGDGLRIGDTNHWVLERKDLQWSKIHPVGEPIWDFWPALLTARPLDPGVLNFCIEYDSIVCGLVNGHTSDEMVSLDFAEACPDPHPLRGHILDLAVVVAEGFGSKLGARVLRLVKPRDRFLSYFKSAGFTVVFSGSGGHYCEREIEP
jgi:hypothetical protein